MKILTKLSHLYVDLTATRLYANLWLKTAGHTVPFGDTGEFRHPVTMIDGVELDEKIFGLVLELWLAGIETTGSCQGDAKLDEKSNNGGANYYGDCYSAFLALPKLEDARIVAKALELACDRHSLHNDKRRIRISTDADISFVHLKFPAKFLTMESFLENFENDLKELKAPKP